MDGGQIDGQEVMVTMCKPQKGAPVRRHKFDHDSNRRYFFCNFTNINFALDLDHLVDRRAVPRAVPRVALRAVVVAV